MIALILAGVANVACAIGCTMYVVLRRRRIRRAKERFGAAAERAAEKKHSIDIEMTKHPSAAIAASEAACREVMRKHLKDYMHANGCNANFKAWIATLHPENVQLDQRMWLDQGEQITLWRELSGNDAPPPSPPKARAPDAPSTLTPTARSAESPSSSLPVLDLKLSELKGRDPDDAPMATLRKGAPDSLRRKTVGSLGRSAERSPSHLPPMQPPHNFDQRTNLRRGRSSETPEAPSSAGVTTTPLMSNVTTPDNSTADVTA
jgi:hypothetical protein